MRIRLTLLWWIIAVPGLLAEPFELKQGDRVVLVGNTLIEREQRYGFWEAALTSRWPDRDVTFRNLGWSGDTVWGEARARFGTQADGFKQLVDHVLALKPTVLIVGYGGNEAFAGPAGLAHFELGLNGLLDALAPAPARVVLLSPLPHEKLGPPLPDPAAHNRDLALYRDAIRTIAAYRHARFVDLMDFVNYFNSLGDSEQLTDNGMHLNAAGYRFTVPGLMLGLEVPFAKGSWSLTLSAEPGKSPRATHAHLEALQGALPRSRLTDDSLFWARPSRTVRVAALPPDTYGLYVDGKQVAQAGAEQWSRGVEVSRGPEFDQAKKLRQAIIAKNQEYFYRWRPQNETYLFGFRKYEQGQNAREIPLFDPVVEKLEKDINRLRQPLSHLYELKRAEK